MAEITLSAGVRQNLLSLQNTADLMSKTQHRLATGKKVNSALDNPTNFFTAGALQSRASDMSALLDNMTTGIKTLEAADNGLTAISKTIESMQSTLRQARQDKSFKSEAYTVNLPSPPVGTEVLSFTGGAFGTATETIDLTTTAGTATAGSVVSGAFAAGMDFSPSGATSGTNSFAYAADGTAFGASDTVTFQIDVDGSGSPQTVTLNQSTVQGVGNNDSTIDDINELTSALSAALTAAGVSGVSVANDGTNVTFTSTSSGTGSSVAISAVTPDADGGGAANTAYGLTNGAGTSGSAGTSPTLSFDIDVDGSGTPTTITIDQAAVAAAGNNNNVIDNLSELAAIVGAQLPAGVSVAEGTGPNAGRLVFTSATTGATSAVAISNVTATGIANTTGIAAASDTGDAAAPRARTLDEIVSAINSDADLKGKIRASNDSGRLRIENISTQEMQITGLSASGEVTGGTSTADIGGNQVRANLVKQFNELRDQLDKLADDASYNGVNLLRGDLLKLTFNETGTSTIEIQAKDLEDQERPINTSTLGITFAVEAEFDSDESIDGKLTGLTQALGVIRSQASAFGSNLSIVENRTQFTKSMINTLQTGADSLVLADTNEEAANMLALQTRQQLSSTALSLASQADQAVLRLF